MERRETRMRESFQQEMQALRNQVAQVRQEVVGIANGAGAQIAQEAKQAVAPVVAQYERAASAASAQVQGAGRTVWMWFAAAGAILLLVVVVGWAVLGYYRRELAAVQQELQRHQDAIPVLQAYAASDATLCGGRLCVNADLKSPAVGDKQQYRQARPRP